MEKWVKEVIGGFFLNSSVNRIMKSNRISNVVNQTNQMSTLIFSERHLCHVIIYQKKMNVRAHPIYMEDLLGYS